MNLYDLLQSNGFQLKRISSTNGGEYAGACPFCGGHDRFRVWPDYKGGRYWCRQCGKTGDAIQLLRDRDGLTYKAACLKLGLMSALGQSPNSDKTNTFRQAEDKVLKHKWLYQAELYLATFQECLWDDQGKEALEFLHSKGLSNESIKSAGLGWNNYNRYWAREEWGLPIEIKPDGKAKKLGIPKGLVMPCYVDKRIIRLRVRCATPGEYSKYILVLGSEVHPMTWGIDKNALIIVESELDGILVNQEAGDLVGVIALGFAQAKPKETIHEALTKTNIILNALDADEPGAKAAWSFWPQTYGDKVKRWPCIMGKDPSEAWGNGLDIRAWVMSGLPEDVLPSSKKADAATSERDTKNVKTSIIKFPAEWLQKFSEEQLERLAIMTVDGGLSDSEALNALGL